MDCNGLSKNLIIYFFKYYLKSRSHRTELTTDEDRGLSKLLLHKINLGLLLSLAVLFISINDVVNIGCFNILFTRDLASVINQF